MLKRGPTHSAPSVTILFAQLHGKDLLLRAAQIAIKNSGGATADQTSHSRERRREPSFRQKSSGSFWKN